MMIRVSLLNLAAIATLLLGAEAGPCKPGTTAATSLAETTSSLAAETTATSIDTTAVTTVADITTTTEAESTTTTAAAVCVETQLFVNPNFDDIPDEITPWSSNAALTQNQPQSGTNALSATFANGEPDYYFKQTLQNLSGKYRFSYYYRVVSISDNADYTCNVQLSAGSVSEYGAMYDIVGGWRTDSVILDLGDDTIAQADVQLGLTCLGEFRGIEVDIDTLAFTRVCGAA
ncbi:uncharacterized protein FSUBG_13899 [Fusarium subglutinans]|uniref:CBM-cenC domain-containing protein n=1 Tax=Gibberella subglutinans TaxID=42677 RepID=A0A8H5NTP4_GIBSU|nr:uncharacterized protein FSUBG_13899 [Fusarium subglutinans]KAF5575545.1 hypothetical protein FSUBG_13899 [Fusarium subglutinans]